MTEDTIKILMGMVILAINNVSIFLVFPRKYSLRFSIGLLTLFTLAFYIVLYLTDSMVPDNGGLPGLAFLPIILFIFSGNFYQKVFAYFLMSICTAFQAALSETIAGIFIPQGEAVTFVVGIVLLAFMYAIYVALIYKLGRRFFERLFELGQTKEWVFYSLGAIFSYIVLIISQIAPGSAVHIIFVLLFILWGFGILCFAIINTHEKTKKTYEAEYARSIVSTGQEYYQKMNEMYDTLGILRHDYKHHLIAVSNLVKNNDIDKIKSYLAELLTHLPDDDLKPYCSNSILNALLSAYAERCTKQEIRFDVQLALPEALSIPDYEMCIILGNLLENAVEACMKKEHVRMIELSVKTQGEMLAVMVKNSFDGNVIESGGQVISSKTVGGFGLRSVKAVAARYNGHILTKWDEKTFSAYAMLKMCK